MADMKVGIVADDSNSLRDSINEAISAFGKGDLIEGNLTVTGHDYWVVLEYGSSPAEPDPGPKPTDPIVLTVPPSVHQHHHVDPYPIAARRAKFLKFFWVKENKWVRTVGVKHPGIAARGFIRRTIATLEPQFIKQLDDLIDDILADGKFPTRRTFVAYMNSYLRVLLREIQEATPVGTDDEGFVRNDDEGNLRNAWQVDLAE